MTEDYAAQRKEYIRQAREAFGVEEHPPLKRFTAADITEKQEEVSSFAWVKVRLLLAFFLFLAYLLCDYTKMELYGYTSEELAECIRDDSLSLETIADAVTLD